MGYAILIGGAGRCGASRCGVSWVKDKLGNRGETEIMTLTKLTRPRGEELAEQSIFAESGLKRTVSAFAA